MILPTVDAIDQRRVANEQVAFAIERHRLRLPQRNAVRLKHEVVAMQQRNHLIVIGVRDEDRVLIGAVDGERLRIIESGSYRLLGVDHHSQAPLPTR